MPTATGDFTATSGTTAHSARCSFRRRPHWGATMYILYGGDFTRSVLVQWVLEEGGLEYELRTIDILKA